MSEEENKDLRPESEETGRPDGDAAGQEPAGEGIAAPAAGQEPAGEGTAAPAAEQESAGEGISGEVVEYYQPPQGREVVEYYVQDRPLPGRRAPEQPAGQKKKRRRGLYVFLICAAAVAGLTVFACLYPFGGKKADTSSETPQQQQEDAADEKITIPTYQADEGVTFTAQKDHGETLTPQEIYRQVNPSVVTVLVQLKTGASVGTGVIFTSDGYVLTNYHVVAGGKDCSVTLNTNVTYAAQYVAGDSDNDVAILKVNAQNLPAAEIGASDALSVGDPVYAIGNPLGVELRGTFTNGIVSAINRDVDVEGRTMTLVQTNAALNSGNSGGPLINQYGQVVGINTIKMSSAFSNIEGLGFALPTSSLQYIVDDLLTYGKVLPEPRLGITVESTGTSLPDGTVGARVMDVTKGSAADLAGVKSGDVIVSADGDKVTGSDDLLHIRKRFHVGDQMSLTVYRDGDYLKLTLDLQEAAD